MADCSRCGKPVSLEGMIHGTCLNSASTAQENSTAQEIRVVSKTGGAKGSKVARYDLLPADALREVAEHFGKGAVKYDAPRNWEKGYDWSLSFAALQRHAWAFWAGEDMDPELQSHHMAAVAFHALVLLENRRINPQFDDRPRKQA